VVVRAVDALHVVVERLDERPVDGRRRRIPALLAVLVREVEPLREVDRLEDDVVLGFVSSNRRSMAARSSSTDRVKGPPNRAKNRSRRAASVARASRRNARRPSGSAASSAASSWSPSSGGTSSRHRSRTATTCLHAPGPSYGQSHHGSNPSTARSTRTWYWRLPLTTAVTVASTRWISRTRLSAR
jgi:hypothetical protein